MNPKNVLLIVLLATLLTLSACNLPVSATSSDSDTLPLTDQEMTATAEAGLLSNETPTATGESPLTAETAPATATTCMANVVANLNANVRSGPGTVYNVVGSLLQNESATVAGKNSDGTWWYIDFPSASGGKAWIAASVTTDTCIPASLAVIQAPPTPQPASGTCKDGFVYREIKASDKVCVPPASKSQAAADNAAANSRKIVNVYGNEACISGYVWREAFSGDKVCVEPSVRSQAAADNAAAASRWTSGAYGPHTCISGYVWREAGPGDDVCVEPAVRTQAAADNAAASSRVAVSVYGPDACISGYVWREAFPGDKVCVEPSVRDQTAADNAAAPGRTW